jgi:hypothetical protein
MHKLDQIENNEANEIRTRGIKTIITTTIKTKGERETYQIVITTPWETQIPIKINTIKTNLGKEIPTNFILLTLAPFMRSILIRIVSALTSKTSMLVEQETQ